MATKLSPRMLEHLAFALLIENSDGRLRGMRPGHPANLRTHEALVRRGLLHEDAERFVTLTDEGRKTAVHELSKLASKVASGF